MNNMYPGADLRGGAPGPGHLISLVKFFTALYFPLLQHQFMYRSKMSIVCMCVTVKIKLTIQVLVSTKHTRPWLGRYAPHAFEPPYSKILDPPLVPLSPSVPFKKIG